MKPKTWWANWMGMHQSLGDAKCWSPQAEHDDLRPYVEKAAYDKAVEEINCLRSVLSEWDHIDKTCFVQYVRAEDLRKERCGLEVC